MFYIKDAWDWLLLMVNYRYMFFNMPVLGARITHRRFIRRLRRHSDLEFNWGGRLTEQDTVSILSEMERSITIRDRVLYHLTHPSQFSDREITWPYILA